MAAMMIAMVLLLRVAGHRTTDGSREAAQEKP
jgi:hypothetical protein